MKINSFQVVALEGGNGAVVNLVFQTASFDEAMRLYASIAGAVPVPASFAPGPDIQNVRVQQPSASAVAAVSAAVGQGPGPSYKGITDRDALKKLCIERQLVDASNKSGAGAFVTMLEAFDKNSGGVTEKVVPAKDTVVEEVHEARAAAAATGGAVPPDLLNATSFRQVMTWMLDNGFKDEISIVAKCDEFRTSVPAIARLSGDLKDRVARALEVLKMERDKA